MFGLANKKALSQRLKCTIKLLNPGDHIEIDYTHNSTGQDVLNELISKLDLDDKDYYGLKLHDRIQWIDLSKTIFKQTKGLDNVIFDLRFKYYPAEPALLASEATRYYLYLQLRSDLLDGRLRTDDQEAIMYLIACILQSELGDYNLDPQNEQYENYVSEFKFIPNQTEQIEAGAMRLHQSEDFQGLKPAESELNFLKKATRLDMYGIEPYPVKEGSSRNHMLIGVNYMGVTTFQDSKKVNQFTWDQIERIVLDNRLVLIYCKKIEKKGSKMRPLFGFRCASQDHAQSFWKLSTEHRYFFTLENTPEEPIVTSSGGLFRKSHKVRYSGRVEKDLLRNHDINHGRSSPLKRSHSLLSKSFTDKPYWQGFEQGKNLQGSLNNIYANDLINKTMPSNLGCFREEEEEDRSIECNNGDFDKTREFESTTRNNSKQRPSLTGSLNANKDNGSLFMGRKPSLLTKNEHQMKYDDKQSSIDSSNTMQDIMLISIFLLTLIGLALIAILIVDQNDRPSSINLLVKRANLEPVSKILRENFYLPVRTNIHRLITQMSGINQI